jgi:L-amino acid N-acyltransferase YncA
VRVVAGDETLVKWVESRIAGEGSLDGVVAAFGIVNEDNKLLGGLVYHHFRGQSIEETFAADSPRCLSRNIISQLLAWPFEVMGCKRITGLISVHNHRSIKLTEGLGFKLEGRMREADEAGDLLIYGLTLEDFRNSKYGKKDPQSS